MVNANMFFPTTSSKSKHGLIFQKRNKKYMDVSENSGSPKSSILIGFSIINHSFWGTTIF